jgi:hypothetical protein
MKITIDIDCTPQEARAFLGLPDVAPLNEAAVGAMRERMDQLLSNDPDQLLKTWMQGLSGMDALQKSFWEAMSRAAGSAGSGKQS